MSLVPETPQVRQTWDRRMGQVTIFLLPLFSFTVWVMYTIGVSPFLRQKCTFSAPHLEI